MMKCAYLFMISTACSLMYPPSMSPGVSIMLKVKPALVRLHIIGLRPSDCTEQHPKENHIQNTPASTPNRNLNRKKRNLKSADISHPLTKDGVEG
jgi:hypothetical protein